MRSDVHGARATLSVASAADMERLGAAIAAHLEAGDLIALNGELGAGKTTLVRGVGEALGARGAVASPTFVIARTHPTARGVPLVHVDAYRLGSAAELDDLDLDFEGSIVAVEWAEGMLEGVTDSWLDIAIERPRGAADEDIREVTITGYGPKWVGLVPHFRLD